MLHAEAFLSSTRIACGFFSMRIRNEVAITTSSQTEMERFELSRRLPDLPHFECGPFSHLGTSPHYDFLRRSWAKKSFIS